MVDGPPSALVASERLEKVKTYQQIWRNPAVKLLRIPLRATSPMYRMPLADSLIAGKAEDALFLWQPPCPLRGIPEVKIDTRNWQQRVQCSPATGWAVDLEQDLLAKALHTTGSS